MPSDRAAFAAGILEKIREYTGSPVKIMEICGTHTMSIARSGIRTLLPESIHLISGPGCPVCVTAPEVTDAILRLTEDPNVILCTYGDMIRVPGSVRGDSLRRRMALGADVRVVYSPMDALEIASGAPEKEIVFLGVGFETTAPGTAAAVLSAAERKLTNFSVLSTLKLVEPAMRTLAAQNDFSVDALLCPGHVGTIIGEKGFRFLPEELGLPSVISGFEAEDILLSIYMLLRQISGGKAVLENEYKRAVAPEGNELAWNTVQQCFAPRDDLWRGLGSIPNSGLGLREEWSRFDAEKKFNITYTPCEIHSACRCGEVITGRLEPCNCPMFGKVCTPEDPMGPCMVSSEGACAAAYKYGMV